MPTSSVAWTSTGASAFGQQVAPEDRRAGAGPMARAASTNSRCAQAQDLGPGQPADRPSRPCRPAGRPAAPPPGPEEGRQRRSSGRARGRRAGRRPPRISSGVDPASAEGRGGADGDAQGERQGHREEPHRERDPGAVEHPRQRSRPKRSLPSRKTPAVGDPVRRQVEHPAGGSVLDPAPALDRAARAGVRRTRSASRQPPSARWTAASTVPGRPAARGRRGRAARRVVGREPGRQRAATASSSRRRAPPQASERLPAQRPRHRAPAGRPGPWSRSASRLPSDHQRRPKSAVAARITG